MPGQQIILASLEGLASKPAPGAEGTVSVGTLGTGRMAISAIVGNGVLTKFVVKHPLITGHIQVQVLKEEGTKGSATKPGKQVAVQEVKIINETELEIVFTTAPEKKEVFWVTITG